MSATWPEDPLGEASLGDVFDEALRPKARPFVLLIPAEVEDQGRDAVAAWLSENEPGHPVIVVPEIRPVEDWCRKVREWEALSLEDRAQQQQDWLAIFQGTDKS